jgi:nucleoside 2-deoxyribosyltransferase
LGRGNELLRAYAEVAEGDAVTSRFKVYLAGSSHEWERVNQWSEMLRKFANIGIVSTWHVQPPDWAGNDSSTPSDIARAAAHNAFQQVDACDVLWLLWPQAKSFGSYIEFGFAVGRGKRTIVSGIDAVQSIFTSRADVRCDMDFDAYCHVTSRAATEKMPSLESHAY